MLELAGRSRPRWTLAAAIAVALAASGCRLRPSTSSAPGKSSSGVSAHCQNGALALDGPYKYENNQWGSGKARGRFEQCLLERRIGDRTERGWSWSWPGLDRSVFAYPEIVFGWKPWSGGGSTDARLPRRISEIEHLSIDYEVETTASGAYNLAPEVWLTTGVPRAKEPNPGLISAEIMFWMESSGEAQPAGRVIDRVTLDGAPYELWKAESIGDKGNGTGWVLYSFRSPTTRRAGVLRVHALLDYLVQRGHVDPTHYVASIEFGNEIVGGSGTTWVRRYAVDVRP